MRHDHEHDWAPFSLIHGFGGVTDEMFGHVESAFYRGWRCVSCREQGYGVAA